MESGPGTLIFRHMEAKNGNWHIINAIKIQDQEWRQYLASNFTTGKKRV
jgi:hypothetical protein